MAFGRGKAGFTDTVPTPSLERKARRTGVADAPARSGRQWRHALRQEPRRSPLCKPVVRTTPHREGLRSADRPGLLPQPAAAVSLGRPAHSRKKTGLRKAFWKDGDHRRRIYRHPDDLYADGRLLATQAAHGAFAPAAVSLGARGVSDLGGRFVWIKPPNTGGRCDRPASSPTDIPGPKPRLVRPTVPNRHCEYPRLDGVSEIRY